MSEQNAYSILNLRKGSTDDEIKRAYVELVKRYDPEKHTERFMVIQNAYERLRDFKKRAREDVFSYNYPRGEFQFTPEERVETPLPDLSAQVRQFEEQVQQGSAEARAALVQTLLMRGYAHTAKKLWREAIKDWSVALKFDPTCQRAKNNLLFCYIYLGYYYALHDLIDEAIQLWESALQMDQDNADLIHNLALATEKAGVGDKAQKYWNAVVTRWKAGIDKDPGNEYLKQCVIEVHKHHGERAMDQAVAHQTPQSPQEAIDQYREILKFNPNDFEAAFNIVQALMQESKFEEALEELKKLQAQHPKNLDVINLMGWAYLNLGKLEHGFNTWRRGLQVEPKSATLRESMARARLTVGKKLKEGGLFTQALVHFKELQKLIPNQWEVHYEIAECMMRKGDRRSALTEYQRVLELDPKNKLARKAIAEIRLRA